MRRRAVRKKNTPRVPVAGNLFGNRRLFGVKDVVATAGKRGLKLGFLQKLSVGEAKCAATYIKVIPRAQVSRRATFVQPVQEGRRHTGSSLQVAEVGRDQELLTPGGGRDKLHRVGDTDGP